MLSRYGDKVTIVMPTIGRTKYVLMNISALHDGGFGGELVIADSSSRAEYEKANAEIKNINHGFVIHHHHTPGKNVFEATSVGAVAVKTPFVVWCADDDFMVPKTLHECGKFLEQNTDYSAAIGHAAIAGLHGAEIYHVGPYVMRGVEDGHTSSERVVNLFADYAVVHFAVVRKDIFMRCVAPSAPALKDMFVGVEIMWNAIYVICGKIAYLNALAMVRTSHAQSVNYPDIIEQITRDDWAASVRGFVEYTAQVLQETEGVDAGEAKKTMKYALSWYLSACMRGGGAKSGGLTERLAVALAGVPTVKKVLKKIRAKAREKQGNPIMSQEELLRDGSLYHDEFMPIYNVLTQHKDG